MGSGIKFSYPGNTFAPRLVIRNFANRSRPGVNRSLRRQHEPPGDFRKVIHHHDEFEGKGFGFASCRSKGQRSRASVALRVFTLIRLASECASAPLCEAKSISWIKVPRDFGHGELRRLVLYCRKLRKTLLPSWPKVNIKFSILSRVLCELERPLCMSALTNRFTNRETSWKKKRSSRNYI